VRAVLLSDLFAGESISVGNLTFSDWTFVDLDIDDGAMARLNEIDVFPLNDDPLNPGIGYYAFTGGFATAREHAGASVVELKYTFHLATTGPPIENSTIRVTDFNAASRPGSRVRVVQDVKTSSGALLSQFVAFARSTDTEEAPNFVAFEQFAFPQSDLFVQTAIAAAGPTLNDFISLKGYEQRFGWGAVVPEPSAWLMVVVLLMSAGTLRIR
jgi:hypothetical protein